ncbi:MAG: DNA mismatch repair endonuclease MutL [Candidatus Nanoarchaeia archaeon]|jgi:DNA mismatch repair protein MutL|nr:DNA mismatch repair endonuclease MutL [Candidatus Nanoarchaeia archaeon]MDD4563726.1 DNA mismatch repair endonuclease MutL [Candidatus Nanoarchaeia archaeon]
MVIKVLNENLINKIAAGEVIERPANVVKELLENSYDSAADSIKIEIIDSGFKKIKISDNGIGMSKEDLLLCVKRYATSKIQQENDLFNIHSFGFRGEALFSIAQVSSMIIITKRECDAIGTRIEVEAGQIKKVEPTACSKGTIIEVNDLFFNTPVRKEYLRNKDLEFSQILHIVNKYALIKKSVSLILTHNNKEIINSPKTDSLLDNIISLYGPNFSKDLIEVKFLEGDFYLSGYISKPNLTRADKSEQSIYVNSRFVKDKIISESVYDAYKTLLFINRHPIFILNLEINPSLIDVNIHPAKEIIKFKDEDKIQDFVFRAIKKAIYNSELITETNIENKENIKPTKIYEFNLDKQTNLFNETNSTRKIQDKEISDYLDNKILKDYKILGQINKTFIILEDNNGLIILDQHAAEERVNYEKYMSEFIKGAIKKQKLLDSKILELNTEQKNIALNNRGFLNSIGFEFEDFGENSLKVSSVPEIFGRLKSVLFLDILNELVNNKGKIIDKEIEERIIKFSCRASVKAGQELTNDEIRKLINNLNNCENPYSCPHGRPISIRLSLGELEKKFKRTGW